MKMRLICAKEGCDRPFWALGFCKNHYLEHWRSTHPHYNRDQMRRYRNSWLRGRRRTILGVRVDVNILQRLEVAA